MNITTIISSVCLLIVSAYVTVTIPISETGIPFTMQSLMVFLLAGTLKSKETFIIVSLYLILGAIGLPVFADGASGFGKLAGSSGGFLYGFLFSGLFISYSIQKLKSRTFFKLCLVFLLATIILFGFGIGHLTARFGYLKALEYGLYPFWKVGLVKALLASILIYSYYKIAWK